jgi:hypothetical protein
LRSVTYTGSPDANGSCSPRPSRAGGSVVPSDPLTLCCTP